VASPLQLGEASTTALVLIECQEGVLGANSVLPALAAEVGDVVPVVARLTRGARAHGVTVVHATFEGSFGRPAASETTPLLRALAPKTADWHAGHPATRVLDAIGLEPADLVIPRHHGLTPTQGTELLPVLRFKGIRTIVFAGVSTNVAIPTSAADAANDGFSVVVPRDAVAGTPRDYSDLVLRHTLAMVATITTTDDLLQSWRETARTPVSQA
jgi:nicotinamidase-related amidase